jgi:hypothetical protein
MKMITEYKSCLKNSKPPHPNKNFQKKNSILHLDLKKILSPCEKKLKNQIKRNDSSSSKIHLISNNETETSTARSKSKIKNSLEIQNYTKIHRKINSLIDDFQTTQDSISFSITSLRKKNDNKHLKIKSIDDSISPKSSRQERLINKWTNIMSDLNNFPKKNTGIKKFKKKVKIIEIINPNISCKKNKNYEIKEPNYFYKENNIKKEKKNERIISPSCNFINLTRKLLEVKISNSFVGKNILKNNSRNKLKDIEREMNIKCKIRAINRFEFNDKKVNLDKKKEIRDNNIKLLDTFRYNITSRDNIIEEDIDVNIDCEEKKIKK